MHEDQLTNTLIESAKKTDDYYEGPDVDCFPEAHYHHYGNRGSVDLYTYEYGMRTPTKGRVLEIKSESAVRHATGANEIIRQFNRMRRFFFDGSGHPVPNDIRFELCFLPTIYNMSHVLNNQAMYNAAVDHEHSMINEPDTKLHSSVTKENGGPNFDPDRLEIDSVITVRPPSENTRHCNIFTEDDNHIKNPTVYLTNSDADPDTYTEYVREYNKHLYEEYYDAIAKLNE